MQFFCKDSHDFGLSLMNRKAILFIGTLLLLFLTVRDLHSGPVKYCNTVYFQPDGTTFNVKVKGDEWLCIRTTSDGCAIVRDADGWWYYGIYENSGTIRNTGYKVGEKPPSCILAESRTIPYKVLSAKNAPLRLAVRQKQASAREAMRMANSPSTRSSAQTTQKRGIAILAEFQDIKFTFTKDDFHNLLNQKGYNGTGSAKDYFEDQLGENWEFSFDVSDIVTLPNNLKYYGENDPDTDRDKKPAEMVRDACRKADDSIDFSLYDQDGDGEVDNIYIFFAGNDEAENTMQTDLIWAHQWYVYDGAGIRLTCDGVQINRYACSSELSGRKSLAPIGTFCHEYAHTFGLPDFYDTNYDNDDSWAAGLWTKTSLMDGGNYNNNGATPPNFNCIERKLLGLSEPSEININSSYTLEPVHYTGQSYIMNSGTEGEYYLFECRSNEGWDKYIGGSGMLVYHIDENMTEDIEGYGNISKWKYNTVNSDHLHQCADLIEADGRSDLITDKGYATNIKGIFYPQPDVTSITPDNTPAYRFWSGAHPEISIFGITHTDGVINFSTTDSAAVPEVPEITGFSHLAYPDAIFISFQPDDRHFTGEASVEWRKSGEKEYEKATVVPSADGSYSLLLKKLESGNMIYEIQVRLEHAGAVGKTYKAQIMTKRSPAISWPYLYMTDGGEISLTEGIIAHVVNASDATEIKWFLDAEELHVQDDCRIYPDRDGTLSCIITWDDGHEEIILKEITTNNGS